ncbi:MAG: hypothetical protein Q8P72_01085 [Candidatus Roizmanbacteria bacterium]|nr:hypothetical protein [Candidatus Roizmanbacteria bacterium]
MTIKKLFKLYIDGTDEKAKIIDTSTMVCNATKTVAKACSLSSVKIYISTKVIKHLYDKRPAEEFNFLINNLHTIVKYPDDIYKNKDSKRGHFAFVKTFKNDKYFSSIEVVENFKVNEILEDVNCIVTCFRMKKEKYLNNYELMWSWKGDKPSS